jgi:predicted RNA-binding Zn ribbon-like protein
MTALGIDDLPLVAGHPALDLVNTVEPRLPLAGRHEHLAVPHDALTWALRAGLVDQADAAAITEAWTSSPAAGDRALTALRQIREALSAVLSALLTTPGPETAADTGPGREAATSGPDRDALSLADTSLELEYLSVTWAAAVSRSRLSVNTPADPAARLVVGSSPALLIPDRAVHAAVELLCDVDVAHLGVCPVPEGGCGWVFIDGSRNRSRRWCSMQDCGSHAKARRLTQRRRQARSSYQLYTEYW